MTDQQLPRIVRCPTCRHSAPLTESNPFRPFCSARCKEADIAKWASEEFRIPGPLVADLSEEELEEQLKIQSKKDLNSDED
jgi:uncharacterized protein